MQASLPAIKRRINTYGTTTQADVEATNISCSPFATDYDMRYHAAELGQFHLRVPGRHNVLNAMAAAAVAMELEVKPDAIREALAAFSGVDRRFQVRGKERGITVVDDYGHHPTEIRATLDAARQCGFRRVHVLFQPHRYSRTAHLMDEFARSFHQADTLFVTDIYAASESPIEGVTAEALVDRIRQFAHRAVEYVGTVDAGRRRHYSAWRPSEMVLTLGAGNVWQGGEKRLARLAAKQPATQPRRSTSVARREESCETASAGVSGSPLRALY